MPSGTQFRRMWNSRRSLRSSLFHGFSEGHQLPQAPQRHHIFLTRDGSHNISQQPIATNILKGERRIVKPISDEKTDPEVL